MNARSRRERAILRGRRRWGPIGNVQLIEEYRLVAWSRIGLYLGEAFYRLQTGTPMVDPIERRP